MKAGRNAPCPCGSGKKFKKCCGAPGASPTPATTESRHEGSLPASATSASFPLQGIPGVQSYLVVQPIPPGGTSNSPGGVPGLYRVVFTLSRPGFSPLPDNSFSFESGLEGDSHLAIAAPAYTPPPGGSYTQILVRAFTPEGSFVFRGIPNKKGFLGKIQIDELHAENLKDAAMKAFRALSSGLSNISIYLDVPLHVYQVDATELSTSTSLISILTPFPVTPLVAVPVETMGSDFRLYASLYREATSSNSPSYQFLCYFKIIEGIRVRHQRRASEAHARGAPIPSSPPEYIPAGPEGQRTWLASLFPLKQEWNEIALAEVFPQEAVGRKLNDVVDKELDGIRNKIAHAILRSGEPTALIDDGHDGLLINKWLPLTKCIARAQLRNEFQEVFRRG